MVIFTVSWTTSTSFSFSFSELGLFTFFPEFLADSLELEEWFLYAPNLSSSSIEPSSSSFLSSAEVPLAIWATSS